MNTRILYISYDGMTDPLGQSQVIPYLAGLAKKGNEITLLSAEKEENYNKHKITIAKLLEENSIQWEPINYTKSPPILSTIKDILALKTKAKQLHQQKAFNIIHCRSYISAFVGLWMQKNYNTKFLFDMRGFWPDERVDGKIWNLQNPAFKMVYAFFKQKEKQFLNAADHIVSLTQAGKDEMLKWNLQSLNSNQISVIPCCADLNHFNYNTIDIKNQVSTRRKLGINNDSFVISYLGSVGTWYMLDEMLTFYQYLLKEKPDAVFFFITKDQPQVIIDRAEQMGIERQNIMVKPAERKQVPEFISVCNASVFFIKPVWSKKASSPTKMAELMGMGIPIVANAGVGDVDQLIKANPTGILINSFSEHDYQTAVNTLINISDQQRATVRQLACDNFSLENGISIFDKIYKLLS